MRSRRRYGSSGGRPSPARADASHRGGSPTRISSPRRHGSFRGSRSPARADASHGKAWLIWISKQRRYRWSGAPRSPARVDASDNKASRTRISMEAEAEIPDRGRSKRRSSDDSTSGCYPTWVILNRVGTRKDSVGDGTTSALAYTSACEQISVSIEFQKPPRISRLTLHWPQGTHPSRGTSSHPHVVAANGNVVLLLITSAFMYPRPDAIDYFVYKADGHGDPSLELLPLCYWKGPRNADSPRPRIMSMASMGILSCSKDVLIIAELEGTFCPTAVTIYLLSSGFDNWKVCRNVHVRDSDDADLDWWSTDVVVPCSQRYLIWVDYFQGIIVADMLNPQEPVLRYLPLPVDPVEGVPYDGDWGRGCPAASRSLCDTHHGIKFVDVNRHGSKFSITLWSLCANQTWRKEATLDDTQFWELDSENRLPKVHPEFPVVDMENPAAVCFLLNERHQSGDPDAPTWLIKVHMKKKILLDFTSMNSRTVGGPLSFISSEIPCYMSGQTIKRRIS